MNVIYFFPTPGILYQVYPDAMLSAATCRLLFFPFFVKNVTPLLVVADFGLHSPITTPKPLPPGKCSLDPSLCWFNFSCIVYSQLLKAHHFTTI